MYLTQKEFTILQKHLKCHIEGIERKLENYVDERYKKYLEAELERLKPISDKFNDGIIEIKIK